LIAAVDPDRLIQAIAKLLSNAITSSPEGGTVALSLQEIDGQIRIAVKNTGPWFAEKSSQGVVRTAVVRTALDRNISGDSRTERSGLAHVIARSLVLKLGAELEFVKHACGGSAFFFDLVKTEDM
jgi:signal transduction histidine kinase